MAAEKGSVFGAEEASFLVGDLRRSFKSGKTKSYEWRVSQLRGIEKMMNEREKDMIEALRLDIGKPPVECLLYEINVMKSSCKKALNELNSWMEAEKVETPMIVHPSTAEIVSEPLGVVLVISTWNYPILLSLDPVVGAIAAGNAVVLKPSELAPAISSLLAKSLVEYVDGSCIRVVEGAVPETTALLDQKWDKIFYTGSGRVGRIIMSAAAKHLTPVALELGGKCPAIVDSNVHLEVAARRIAAGKWASNNGQTCVAIDYIITANVFAPILIDALKGTIQEFFGENPMDSQDISRILNSSHFARLSKLLDEDGVSNKIVLGGQRDTKQLKIAPTVLLDVPEESQIMQEEIFGPLLPILTVDDIHESFDMLKSKPSPLGAYLFTNCEEMKKKFVDNVTSGGMIINDAMLHAIVPNLPFGGVGESGIGKYHGKFSFDTFSNKKAVLYRSFEGDNPLRYPPYNMQQETSLREMANGNA